jgi:hypothetical protein
MRQENGASMPLCRTHINAGGGYTSNHESGELNYDCKCKHNACHAAYVMRKREPIGCLSITVPKSHMSNARTSSDPRDNTARRRRRRGAAFHRNRRTDGHCGRRHKQRDLQRVRKQRHARSSVQKHARSAGERRSPAPPEEGLFVIIHDGRHVAAADAAVDADAAHGSGGALLAHYGNRKRIETNRI